MVSITIKHIKMTFSQTIVAHLGDRDRQISVRSLVCGVSSRTARAAQKKKKKKKAYLRKTKDFLILKLSPIFF